MRPAMFAILSAAACNGGGGGDGDCTPLQDGDWTVDGSAMVMPMPTVVTMDAEGCTFEFSDWTMPMSVPTGGSLSGTDLTLDGDAHWSSCTGTVNEDGSEASGVCSDDGTEFTMVMGTPQTGTM